MVPSPERSLHLRVQASPRLMPVVRASSMAMPSGRGLGRHCQAHHAGAVVTTEGICRRLHALGRPAEVAGALGTARSRWSRPARDTSPCSRTRPWGPSGRWRPAADKDAIERRLGGARGLLDFRTPRVSAEGTLAGRLLVVFVALVLTAWLRRRTRGGGLDGDHAPGGLLDGAGATGRHAREGHRPRVCEVTGRQRDIFDRLGYGLPTTS